jgi:hypothetical protein
MKFLLAFLACLLCAAPTLAGTLTDQEAAKLKSEVAAMYEALEKGDPSLLVAKAHPAIYRLAGSKQVFEEMARAAPGLYAQIGYKVLSSELGTPSPTHAAGEEEICFVPRIAMLEIQGKKARSTGVTIAVRRIGDTTWKLIDAAPLRQSQRGLQFLFPELPGDVELPPIAIEFLPAEVTNQR